MTEDTPGYALMEITLTKLEQILKVFYWLPEECEIEAATIPDDKRTISLRLKSKQFDKTFDGATLRHVQLAISLEG